MSTKWEGPILRARGADFRVKKWGGRGGLMQMCKHEQTRGVWGMLSRENFKFKSSEMAINASKPANSNTNLLIITSTFKLTSYNLAPTLD